MTGFNSFIMIVYSSGFDLQIENTLLFKKINRQFKKTLITGRSYAGVLKFKWCFTWISLRGMV